LCSNRFDLTCGDASPEELWQTRLGLLADRPGPLPTAAVAQESFSGLDCEVTECEATETSAVSGSGTVLSDSLLEHHTLWHLRLSLYFDSRECDPHFPVSAASSPAPRLDFADFDLDMEELKDDLKRWLSPQQLNSLGMQAADSVTADPGGQETKKGYSLAWALTSAAFILLPLSTSIASAM